MLKDGLPEVELEVEEHLDLVLVVELELGDLVVAIAVDAPLLEDKVEELEVESHVDLLGVRVDDDK